MQNNENMQHIRIGFGFDVHPLREGRKFILGGIEIPAEKGPDGHSDADVLIHAICDALLGAAGMRDIGNHFPDTDDRFKDADSTRLLKEVCELLRSNHYYPGNIDCTVAVEEPKLNPYIPAMVLRLSEVLQTETGNISIKATTHERMGFVGEGKGIAAYAVALLFRKVL